MTALRLFGCNDYYTGGKIIAIISLVENFVRAAISVAFLVWAVQENQTTYKLERGETSVLKSDEDETINLFNPSEILHAEVYAVVGIIGFVLSILLLVGISKKSYKFFIPWICFQLTIICYQVYFSCEVVKSGSFEISQYSSIMILMIFVFHTICEGYYLCLVISISQVIANYKVIGNLETGSHQEVHMKVAQVVLRWNHSNSH